MLVFLLRVLWILVSSRWKKPRSVFEEAEIADIVLPSYVDCKFWFTLRERNGPLTRPLC
jgi:hypothetical protein